MMKNTILVILFILTTFLVSSEQQEQECSNNDVHNESCVVVANDEQEVAVDYWYYNPHWHADNVFEVTVDKSILQKIRAGYDEDIHPHYHTNKSTDNFCLVSPYNPETSTWAFVEEARSDIRWYSVNNEKTYEKYEALVKQLGLMEALLEKKWIDAKNDEPTIYGMFFIPRSFSKSYEFHEDWGEESGTQVATFLLPLSDDFNIGLAYKDNDGKTRNIPYAFGKGVGIGGGFMHSTGKGQSKESQQDVLLCVYIGSSNKRRIWKYALGNIADELEHYMSPFDGFVRNENLNGGPSKCQ